MSSTRFSATVIAAYISFGLLYNIGVAIFADAYAAMAPALYPEEETIFETLTYHMVQTIIFVWLFHKCVGSADIKAGALFGAVMGVYLVATDAIWYINVKDFPQDARAIQAVLNIVIESAVGALVAVMYGIGRERLAPEQAA